METGSLFRVVDACSVEATVLSNAEKRTRNATIPSFNGTDSLGFGAKSLRNFCATADAVVLGMASEATKQEGQKLRERGVANLIARDRVHMKEQILRGLLLRLWKQDNGLDSFGDANNPGAASTTSGNKITSAGLSNESPPSFDSHMDHREDLIKVGAVTPFDDLESHPTSGVQTRGRMTLMDHKIAEGMKVKLPRSFCRGAKETVSSGGAQNRNGRDTDTDGDHEKGNEHDAYPSISDSKNPRGTNASSSGYSGDEQHESKDCKNESPQGKSDTDSRNGWVCEACTLVCPGVMVCLDCGKRRPRTKHFLADSCRSHENGVTSILGHSNVRDARSTSGMTDDRHKRRNTRRLSAKIINRRSEIKSRSDPGPEDKKRDVGSRTSRNSSKRAYQNIASVAKTGIELRAAGGGQLLVDDYSDVDFEARKAQGLANAPVIDDSDSSALRMTDFGDGLKMNGAIVQRLFQFQVTGVRWMWQLHKQGAGGIVGDEMGLGKTVQVSAFLGALYDSNVMRRALVVCPATVLSHWMAELHEWAPQMRVVILHRCAHAFNAASGSSGKIRTLVRQVFGWSNVVVVTSYEGLKSLKASLLPCDWDYAILDEGQRIRNPDAEVTLISKQIRTVHRLVLTGTPIQNNLRELWSLFDFVFPGRLGALPAFEAEFSSPIRVGGYANASPMQARLAYRCALVLRDLIHPYLLRRQKKDLKEIIRLPAKTEQVLFCRLTLYQRRLYSEFLQSAEVKDVLRRTTRSFRAITILRKLCNHPDLVCNVGDSLVSRYVPTKYISTGTSSRSLSPYSNRTNSTNLLSRLDAQNLWGGASDQSEYDAEDVAEESEHHEHGAAQRSGKLLVLQQILPLWHKQGHRVLLFSQTRQMLNIVERFLEDMAFSYGRLDGNTPVSARQTLINRFNSDESIFVMLLTTRTGGVGVNLTGADRVILFDPDWNPSTDMQARERSWRVGQARQVTIYRLITTGTIEEKIYHRQIFKTALTNRVLQDPKQRRLFSADELGDLFTLGEDCSLDGLTDTVDLFQGEGKVNVPDRGDQSQSGSTRDKSDGISRKRVRKQSRKVQLDKPAPLGGKRSEPYETPPNPSALIGTATVALEPAAGSSAKPTVGPDEPKNDKSKSDDQAVLQALYDGAPLSSVFQHDFAEGSGVSTVEHKRMEEVAKRAAQKALNQLRMSRRTLRAGAGQGGFQSSWTGRNGGSPENTIVGENMNDPSQNEVIRRFGTVTNPGSPHGTGASSGSLTGSSTQSRSYFDSKDGGLVSERGSSGSVSSQDILRQIRSRNGSRQPSLGLLPELHDSGTSQDKDAYYASLLERVQDFLAQAPSGVDTAALIHTFSDVRPADVPVFRQLLQAIAVCNNGEWTLRVARDD